MAVYSVFEPPARAGETAGRPERFAFVRDGFSWAAFLFGPLWMLAGGMWLALVIYLAVTALLSVAMTLAAVPANGQVTVAALLALLVGFEAPTLRRWTLQRRRWRELGIVVADDVEAAERRFFDGWAAGGTSAVTATPQANSAAMAPSWPLPAGSPSTARTAHSGPDIIGLFPESGTK